MDWTQALSDAGIKSTQLMPLQVNTTHTMGVDVIDKTVGGRRDDPLTQNHWNGEEFSFTGGHAACTKLSRYWTLHYKFTGIRRVQKYRHC